MNAPKIIQAQGCKSCSHSAVQRNQLVCTLNPPTAAPVFCIRQVDVAADDGRVTQESVMKPVGWTSSFPPVAPDLKCGQWKPRLAVATAVEKAAI